MAFMYDKELVEGEGPCPNRLRKKGGGNKLESALCLLSYNNSTKLPAT